MAKKLYIGLETAQKLAAVWAASASVKDAFERIGFGHKDMRSMQRMRRQAEELLGHELPTINTKNSSNCLPKRTAKIEIEQKKVFAIFSDAHIWPHQHSDAMGIFLRVIKDLKPDYIIDNGDSLDAPTISRHAPNTWQFYPTLEEEIKAVNQYLGWIKEQCPRKTKYHRTIGNHDLRVEAKAQAALPEFKGVKGLTISDMFPGWDHNYSITINEHTMIKHRWHGGMHAAHNNVVKAGINLITGHTHRLVCKPYTDFTGIRYGIETGTLSDPFAECFEYMEDNPRNWQPGFVILTVCGNTTEDINCELVEVKNGQGIFRGNIYKP